MQFLAFAFGWLFGRRGGSEQQATRDIQRMNDEEKNYIDFRLDFYNTCRNYIIHQDNLLNNRMTWLLAIHGFLYAAYGLTIQKKFDLIKNVITTTASDKEKTDLISQINTQIDGFLKTIMFVGFSISLVAFGLLIIAGMAATSVNQIGNRSLGVADNDRSNLVLHRVHDNFYLPGLFGGGREVLPKFGRFFQLLIPIILIISWIDAYISLTCRVNILYYLLN